jgi:hypothetical protein
VVVLLACDLALLQLYKRMDLLLLLLLKGLQVALQLALKTIGDATKKHAAIILILASGVLYLAARLIARKSTTRLIATLSRSGRPLWLEKSAQFKSYLIRFVSLL